VEVLQHCKFSPQAASEITALFIPHDVWQIPPLIGHGVRLDEGGLFNSLTRVITLKINNKQIIAKIIHLYILGNSLMDKNIKTADNISMTLIIISGARGNEHFPVHPKALETNGERNSKIIEIVK